MIPLRLSFRQFLSYKQAVLDFSQLHTACICGDNGAGKSALLEGLTWGIWGQSRVGSEDNLIRQGATEAFVEVVYQSFGQTYRILRSRALGGAGQFGMANSNGRRMALDYSKRDAGYATGNPKSVAAGLQHLH